MRRETMHRIGWVVISGAVAAISLELAVRVDDWAQFAVPLTSREVYMSELLVRDSAGMHARPGAQFRKFRVNQLGGRGPEIGPNELANAPLVIATGASETFGLYEGRDHEWPRQLEDSLHARCGSPARILNAAFAGMTLPTVRQDIARRLGALHPRAIIYYPTPMQYLETDLPVAAAPSLVPPSPLPRWRSRAIPRFRDAIKRVVPEAILNYLRVRDAQRSREALGATSQLRPSADRLDAFDRDLRGLVGELRARGIVPVLMLHGNRFRDTTSVSEQRWLRAWERFYPLYGADAIIAFDDSAAVRTQRLARDSGVLVVDPRPALAAQAGQVFADFSHFTDLGSAKVAAALVPVVCGALSSRQKPDR